MAVHLTKFNAPAGTGNSEPLGIGRQGDRTIYLNLRVYRLADSPDRTLQFTVYSVREAPGRAHEWPGARPRRRHPFDILPAGFTGHDLLWSIY